MRIPFPGLCSQACTRRTFIRTGVGALALLALPCRPTAARAQEVQQGFLNPRPAAFFSKLPQNIVQCQLCPRTCEVRDGDRGECGVRENRQGEYYTLVYGNPCAVHVDPVEKKPLFHVSLPPEKIVAAALKSGSRSIAYTYVEPIIFYEYMLDIARRAQGTGLLNVCHSAGYVNPEPLTELTAVLDAACIDLKAFETRFYQDIVGGNLGPVLKTLQILRRQGVHLEIVNLVIPQFNDQPQSITRMCQWIRDELGPLTPLHFSRFYPLYKMLNHYPTPVSTLERCRDLALEAGLKYVYLGNIPGNPAENTCCHACGKLLIGRTGYRIGEMHLKDGKCAYCGAAIPGIWKAPPAA
jgi:pyruvate formate lyase activating enzyme